MKCDICERIKNKKGVIYENEKIAVFIPEDAFTAGHLVIATKEHYPILEAIPDFIVSEMFVLANKAGMAVFESLGAQGTNILIQNGTSAGQEKPHVLLHVIPRKENDGLNLQWAPKQMDQEEMSTIELKIKYQTDHVGVVQSEEQKPITEEEVKEEKEDYKKKTLIRIP